MKFLNDNLAKFAQLSLRERLLVLLVAALVLYFAFDAALLTPQAKRTKLLQQSAQAHRVEKDALTAKLVALQADQAKGAAALQRQRDELAALQQQIAAAERFYSPGAQQGAGLAALLRELLATNPNVSLLGLKTQPASVFFSPADQPKDKQAGKADAATAEIKNVIYRSGVDVSLKGTYPDLQAYLATLERRSGQLFWPGVQLDASSYPQATLKLSIATLGADASPPLN